MFICNVPDEIGRGGSVEILNIGLSSLLLIQVLNQLIIILHLDYSRKSFRHARVILFNSNKKTLFLSTSKNGVRVLQKF